MIATTLVRAALVAALSLVFGSAVGAQEPTGEDHPSIVVTTAVLGSIVSPVVGDAADVTVLMPSGADPHGWEPSARDAERIMAADLVVENGLGLEEGLLRTLEQARTEGVAVFTASDHVAVRESDEDDHDHGEVDDHAETDEHDHGDEGDHAEGDEHADDHDHGPQDPHIWLDPVAMGDLVQALVPVAADLGIDVSDGAEAFAAQLDMLDAEIAEAVSAIPAERRKLVTGHQVLGYFADRYGLEQIGFVLPSLSTTGDVSARDVAELIATMQDAGIAVLFTDVGTPTSVADAVAEATGASVVPLSVEQLPPDGSYLSLMRDLAGAITSELAG